MEVFFLVISALIFCKVVFQKSPFSLFFCIAAVVAGTVMKSYELAIMAGAYDFLQKPIANEDVAKIISKASK